MGGKDVRNVATLQEQLTQATRGKEDRVSLLVGFDRSGERLLTVIEAGRAGLEDPGLEARKAWVAVNVQVLTPELADAIGEIADGIGVKGRSGVRCSRR